jgi:hypothetical protein
MEETIGGNGSREKGERPNIPHVKPSTPIRRIPWKTIGLVLAGAALVAWVVGFLAGLIVRFGFRV